LLAQKKVSTVDVITIIANLIIIEEISPKCSIIPTPAGTKNKAILIRRKSPTLLIAFSLSTLVANNINSIISEIMLPGNTKGRRVAM
jgi:hypothetical protein